MQTKDRLIARFGIGWGVWSGMRVDAAPGVARNALGNDPDRYSVNPQILAGTAVVVRAGVAVDAHGRTLTLCSERIVDLSELAAEVPSAPKTQDCSAWFSPRGDVCGGTGEFGVGEFAATEYWLVAEHDEVPARPMPQYAGAGACDPAPGCDFSRRIECVALRLVRTLPSAYFLTGCLEDDGTILPRAPREIDPDDLESETPFDEMRREKFEFLDHLNELAGRICCARPAVVLARILVTSSGALAGTLRAPVFTIIDDGYPFRRPVTALSPFTMYPMQVFPFREAP